MKNQPTDLEENTCKSYLIRSSFRKYMNSYNLGKKKNLIKKLEEELNRVFWRWHIDGQKAHEKVFHTTNYQRHANQSRQVITSLPLQWLSSKRQEITNCQGCKEKEILSHCWWGYKLVQPLWKTVWGFLKKLKIGLPYDSAIPLLDIYSNWNQDLMELSHTSVHCFTIHNNQDMEAI